MSMRIQISNATVKDLQSQLQHAYRQDDVRLVRRISVLLDLRRPVETPLSPGY